MYYFLAVHWSVFWSQLDWLDGQLSNLPAEQFKQTGQGVYRKEPCLPGWNSKPCDWKDHVVWTSRIPTIITWQNKKVPGTRHQRWLCNFPPGIPGSMLLAHSAAMVPGVMNKGSRWQILNSRIKTRSRRAPKYRYLRQFDPFGCLIVLQTTRQRSRKASEDPFKVCPNCGLVHFHLFVPDFLESSEIADGTYFEPFLLYGAEHFKS